jgi:predicted DNA-binding protein (MmcQ/YjbR family)
MHLDELREYCLAKKGVEECLPFGNDTLVFKVMGKMFLLCGIDSDPMEFNVKCLPEKAVELREKYACVQPGYHMNKQHWNTIICDHSVSDKLLMQWIDESYQLVAVSLTKKVQSELNNL